MRRIAVSRLHLPDGTVLKNQVLELSADEKSVTNYYPLTQELPFTEWRGGDYYLGENFK